MLKTNSALIEKCQNLRKNGFSLGHIANFTNLSKSTVLKYITGISLPVSVKEKILQRNTKRIRMYCPFKKGRCAPGREIIRATDMNSDLIFLVSHFMFDGEINKYSCIYNNRNEALIKRVQRAMKKVFNLQPYAYFNKLTGVNRISYHNIELADHIRKWSVKIVGSIKNAPFPKKKIFIQSFFDDEGSVHYKHNLVRGFQDNFEILQLIQALLDDFGIKSRIDKKYKEIVISRKENITKFKNKVNFSKGVYINPERKNSIWKKKIEKRVLLENTIKKYLS